MTRRFASSERRILILKTIERRRMKKIVSFVNISEPVNQKSVIEKGKPKGFHL